VINYGTLMANLTSVSVLVGTLDEPCTTIETALRTLPISPRQWVDLNAGCEQLAHQYEAIARRLRACKDDLYAGAIEIEGGEPTAE
jgi:hypothetical protein